MSAKPKYAVILKVCIGQYEGDWDGQEQKYEDKVTILSETPSQEYAELMYKNLGGKLVQP